MSLAYSGDICWTEEVPRTARCHDSVNARKIPTDTTAARSGSETVMEHVQAKWARIRRPDTRQRKEGQRRLLKGEGRRAVPAGRRCREASARTERGPALAVQ